MKENHEGPAHHHHPPITGEAGELVDLFMDLIDREPEREPHWWYNYGQMVLFRFSRGFFTESMDRATAMDALREVLKEAITDGGITENFLIRSLKRDLEDWVRDRTDTSIFNKKADQARADMERIVGDPLERDRWRQSLANVNPKYATWTDEQLIEDAERMIESSPITCHVSADDAANRWADAEEWQRLGEALLPDVVFEHWQHLNIKREQERGL